MECLKIGRITGRNIGETPDTSEHFFGQQVQPESTHCFANLLVAPRDARLWYFILLASDELSGI